MTRLPDRVSSKKEIDVLKKAGVVAVAAAGMLMIGAPAFASESGAWGHHHQPPQVNQNIDILHNVNAVLGACGNDVAVLGAVVPILSPNPTGECASGGIIDAGNGPWGH